MLINRIYGPRAYFGPAGEGNSGGDEGSDPQGGDQTVAGGAGDDTVAGGASGEGDPGGGGDPSGEPPPSPPPAPKTDWKDKEIARKHRQLKEREDEIARLKRENEEFARKMAAAAAAGGDGDGAGGESKPVRQQARQELTEADIEARAEQKALQMQAERDAQAAFLRGKEAYKEKWDEAYNQVRMLGGLDDEAFSFVMTTDNPEQVIYELGSNPAEYQRIMELPSARRLTEFVKLSLPKAKAPAGGGGKRVSSAPDPIDPISGGGGDPDPNRIDPSTDKLSDAEWYRRREAQKRASKGRPWSRVA